MEQFNYKQWADSVNAESADEVVKALTEMLTREDFSSEQKMYGVGLLVAKNKEKYLNRLKNDIRSFISDLNRMRNENQALRNRNRELMEQVKKQKPQTVVVARKKKA